MTPAAGTTGGRPAVFVQQLHRAAAQRGRLDPVFQDLSDHWTLDPSAAVSGVGADRPRAVGSRAHRDPLTDRVPRLRRRCSAPRAAIAAGALESGARSCAASGSRCTRRCHAKHTKRWAIEHDIALSESDGRRTTGSWRLTGGCSRSRGWRRTASASSRPTAARPVRPPRAAGRGDRRDPARIRRTGCSPACPVPV